MTPNHLDVAIPAGESMLEGTLAMPASARGIVVFAHGSGSSRHSPRNVHVAQVLQRERIATLLFDLLTRNEDRDYDMRFNIELLTQRLLAATDWLSRRREASALPIGYFGASTGAAAALRAAAALPQIAAVVSRGGRPDLAGGASLERLRAPTLLVVGSNDDLVIELNRQALDRMTCENSLVIVPGASHLFEEPGTLDIAARHACIWFGRWFDAVTHAP